MKKNAVLENVLVEKLVFGGKGFARLESQNPDINGKAIFISGGVIPGSRVNVRVIKSRKDFIDGQCQEILVRSPLEIPHPNNPYGLQAGCGRVNIPYAEQLKIKAGQVEEALFHLKKLQDTIPLSPIVPSPLVDGYRNKIEFSFGKHISHKDHKSEHFNLGFHKQGEFSKIEDFDGTILISDLLNTIFQEIKAFAKASGLPVYDQFNQQGFFRHVLMRQAFFTNQVMIVFSFNPNFQEQMNLDFLHDFFQKLAGKYPQIASVYLSHNNSKADIAIGRLECIVGNPSITEELLGISFRISPASFFQTNSYGAQKLYQTVLDQIDPKTLSDATVLDLYGGTGTIGMIFAKYAKRVVSVELSSDASKDAKENAHLNHIDHLECVNAKVEDFLKDFIARGEGADLLVIDPPRVGMHPDALPNVVHFQTKYLIYVSCNPATLARDLQYLLKEGNYLIKKVTPVDMFPHTHHIETVVLLEKK